MREEGKRQKIIDHGKSGIKSSLDCGRGAGTKATLRQVPKHSPESCG